MKHAYLILTLCFAAGCSTNPIADSCDYFKPGKMYPNKVTPYGGVNIPQGPIVPPMPSVPGAVPLPGPGAITGGAVPPPAPLPPGGRPPGADGIQLQPPSFPTNPPLPPTPPKF